MLQQSTLPHAAPASKPAPDNQRFVDHVLPIVRRFATRAHLPYGTDRETFVADVCAKAWEFWIRKPNVPRVKLATFAAKHVREGRQFPVSSESADSPLRMRQRDVSREYTIDRTCTDRDNPADIVATKLDFEAWFATLSHRNRAIVRGCLRGDTTSEMALAFGVSRGRISQLRRELVDDWHLFTA